MIRIETNQKDQRRDDISALWFFTFLTAILVIAGLSYAVSAASDPVFERAEVYFAEGAREMLASGRYVTPYYLNQAFFDKPVLTYWAILASLRAFGVTHFAARLPSILASLATVVVTAYGTARLAGRKAGLMAATVLGSCYLFNYFAMLCMSDMLLTLLMTAGSFLLLAGSLDAARRGILWWSASVCLALAVLTKGPIGVVLPVAAIFAYLALTGGLRQIRIHHVLLGLATIGALAGAWFFALWRENGTHSLYAFFVVENVKRFTGAAYPRQQQFGYIPVSFIVATLPWSILLPAIGWNAIRKWRAGTKDAESRGELFCWCYLAVVIMFFWASRMQLDYYVLPALPAFAALTGSYLSQRASVSARDVRGGAWILASVLLLLGGVAAIYLPRLLAAERPVGAWMAPAWFCIVGVVMMVLISRRKYLPAYAAVFIALCGGVPLSVWAVQPAYLRFLLVPDYARAVRQTGDGTTLAISSDLEAWRSEFAFQTGRVPQMLDRESDLAAFGLTPGSRVVVFTETGLEKLPADAAAGLHVISRRAGWVSKVNLATALAPPSRQNSALQTIILAVSADVALSRTQ